MTRSAAVGNIAGIVLAAIAAVVSSTQAKAHSPRIAGHEAPRSQHVRLAGLDLGTERDRRKLDRRLLRGARRVCSNDGPRELSIVMAERQCIRETLAAARQRSAGLIARNRLAAAQTGD